MLKYEETVKQLQHHENDKGSSEVQVISLTEKINSLLEHTKKNHKDYSSKRGLVKMVCQRRKHLDYLKRTNPESYAKLLSALNLRK